MSLQERFYESEERRRKPHVFEGDDVERMVFGSPVIPLNERHDEKMPFEAAVKFVMQHQPNALQRSRIVRELRTKVAELCVDKITPVKFFTAVGTSLDLNYGADAFFEQGGHIATIDISLREKDHYKADAMIVVTINEKGDILISDDVMAQAVRDIARRLNSKSLH